MQIDEHFVNSVIVLTLKMLFGTALPALVGGCLGLNPV